jgi:hypothetical protein
LFFWFRSGDRVKAELKIVIFFFIVVEVKFLFSQLPTFPNPQTEDVPVPGIHAARKNNSSCGND